MWACKLVVPGHGEPSESIESSAASNRSLAMDVAECIVGPAEQPSTADSLFIRVLERFDAPVFNTESYFLLHPTIYAFFSYLERSGAIVTRMDGKRMVWEAA